MSTSIWVPGSNNVPAVDPLSQIASQRFTAVEGQTSFTITTFTYATNVGALTVYVNRTKIPATEVTETSDTTFTLLQPCDVGDLVEVVGQTAIEDPSNAVNQAEAAAAAAAASAAEAAADAANAAQDADDAAASAALAASYVPTNWTGQWLPATAYAINDAVFNVDGSYVCITAHTSSATFPPDAANWTIIAQSGGVVSINGEIGVVTLTSEEIPFTPFGGLSATNVDDALIELDAEKVTKVSDTAGMYVPFGTTAERDATPVYGEQRANSTLNQQEWWNGTAWVPMGGGAVGASGNPIIFENDIHVTGDYDITTGKNGMSAGPIIVDNGVTVTVPPGSVWSIV
jgi:hypothetical protein